VKNIEFSDKVPVLNNSIEKNFHENSVLSADTGYVKYDWIMKTK